MVTGRLVAAESCEQRLLVGLLLFWIFSRYLKRVENANKIQKMKGEKQTNKEGVSSFPSHLVASIDNLLVFSLLRAKVGGERERERAAGESRKSVLNYLLKTLLWGLRLARVSQGEEALRNMKRKAMMTPETVAWVSPIFTPSKCITLIE